MRAKKSPMLPLRPDEWSAPTKLVSDLPTEALADFTREVVLKVAKGVQNRPQPEKTALMVKALLDDRPDEMAELISALKAQGLSDTQVVEHHLAAAARMMGTLWETDRLTFAEVTVGSARLLRLLQRLRPPPAPFAPHIYLATVPGDDHTVGATAAAQVLGSAGWDVTLRLGLSRQAFLSEIKAQRPPIVGLSAGSEDHLPALMALIAALRSDYPETILLVGGPLVDLRGPQIVAMGVDIAVASASAAVDALKEFAQPQP